MWQQEPYTHDPEYFDEVTLERLFPTSLPILNATTGLKRRRPADENEPETAVTSSIEYQSHKRLRNSHLTANPLGITTQIQAPDTTRSVIEDPFLNGIFVDQIILLGEPLD